MTQAYSRPCPCSGRAPGARPWRRSRPPLAGEVMIWAREPEVVEAHQRPAENRFSCPEFRSTPPSTPPARLEAAAKAELILAVAAGPAHARSR